MYNPTLVKEIVISLADFLIETCWQAVFSDCV